MRDWGACREYLIRRELVEVDVHDLWGFHTGQRMKVDRWVIYGEPLDQEPWRQMGHYSTREAAVLVVDRWKQAQLQCSRSTTMVA